MTSDFVYDIIGACGTAFLGISLAPQVYRVVKRQSSRDLSFTRQIVFFIGIVMYLTYYAYWGLWAVFYPNLMSFVFIISLLGMKIKLDGLPCWLKKGVTTAAGDVAASGDDMARDAGDGAP